MEVPNIFSNKDEEIVYSPNKYRETEGQMKRYFKIKECYRIRQRMQRNTKNLWSNRSKI